MAEPTLVLPEARMRRLLEVREVLMFSFDFEILEHGLAAEEYATPSRWLPAFVVPGATTAVLGRDAMGGVYVACRFSEERLRCVHLDTRGYAVPLGESLEGLLALVLALPYWQELLLACPSGKLEDMRALALRLEQEVCDELPAMPLARDDLRRFLELPELNDPVRQLHELAVEQAQLVVLSPNGWHYDSPIASSRLSARVGSGE